MSEEGYKTIPEGVNEDADRMTLEDAQTEANLIRSIISGAGKYSQSTKEDYDKAIESLENLINKAESEINPTNPSLTEKMKVALIDLIVDTSNYVLKSVEFAVVTPLKTINTLAGNHDSFDAAQRREKEIAEKKLNDLHHRASELGKDMAYAFRVNNQGNK